MRVLVTGATSGLGRETAIQLGRRGWRVAITGRREDRLAETAKAVEAAGGECLPLLGSVVDLEVVKGHYAKIKEKWGGLDWAILNAGVGDSMNAREFSAENYHWTFATNVGGVVNWLEAVIPDMLAQKAGVIAGIASIAGYRGLPNSGAYSASKAALITLLESTRVDLRGTGISVVTVSPGYVESEITARNDPKDLWFMLPVEEGVRRLLKGIDAKKRLVHFPWQLSCLMIHVVHNLPDWLYDAVIARLISRKKKPSRR